MIVHKQAGQILGLEHGADIFDYGDEMKELARRFGVDFEMLREGAQSIDQGDDSEETIGALGAKEEMLDAKKSGSG